MSRRTLFGRGVEARVLKRARGTKRSALFGGSRLGLAATCGSGRLVGSFLGFELTQALFLRGGRSSLLGGQKSFALFLERLLRRFDALLLGLDVARTFGNDPERKRRQDT